MSLQLLAKQMEAKGRKGDSMLVHMTPGEVAGLQKLAESAGGSLSVNPETGLVEANFLKRMLPTLVGIGVGIGTGNPFLGAAAGAAVGGYQAKENDQDVGMGMLMGGLGGYGGAGLGAGLTAAGGTTAANVAADAAAKEAAQKLATEEAAKKLAAEEAAKKLAAEEAAKTTVQAGSSSALTGAGANPFAAPTSDITLGMSEASLAAPPQPMLNAPAQSSIVDPSATPLPNAAAQPVAPAPTTVEPSLTAAERTSRAGEGIGQLATKEGRAAFGKEFGMTEAGAGIAPMMAPGKKPEKAPVDDEMYSYTYDVGRTGAERSPLATSSERKYFDGRYSPVRKIRASEYGFAEGGETAADAPSASEVALAYLMGERSSSSAGLPALATRMATSPASNIGVGADNMYAFDPATGTFIRNPNYVDPTTSNNVPGLVGQLIGGSSGTGRAPLTKEQERFLTWEETTPEGRANRDARLQNAGYIFNLGPTGLVLGAAKSLITGDEFKAPDFNAIFGTPQAYKEYASNAEPSWVGLSADKRSPTDADYYSASDAISGGGIGIAEGGLVGLAKGGMASGGFVVPADVVSMVGEGNTDAGYKRIKAMIPGAVAIKGKDGGQADTVKTRIDGKQPARVAHGEMYIPPATVKRMGGAKKLYAMMDRVRAQATGSTKQIRPVSLKKAMA